jgi:hypothetical protein
MYLCLDSTLALTVLSFDGEIVVVARSTDGRSRRCQLVALNVKTGSTLGELGGSNADLSPVVFAPRLGDGRLVANCNETGAERPLIWDIAAGKRTDLSMVTLDGDVEAVDWCPNSLALLGFPAADAALGPAKELVDEGQKLVGQQEPRR